MGFVVTCESCQKRLSIPVALYEKKVKGRVVTITCRSCQRAIRIDATVPPPQDESLAPPAGPPSARGQTPPPSSRRLTVPTAAGRPSAPSTLRADAGTPNSRSSGAPRSQRPGGLGTRDLEFPKIPRAPALPELNGVNHATAARELEDAEAAHLAVPRTPVPEVVDALPAPREAVDDGWDDVPEDALSDPLRALDEELSPPSSARRRARFEERTRAEPVSTRDSGHSAPGFPEELGVSVDEQENGPAPSAASADAAAGEGALSLRPPIAAIGRYTLFDKFAVGGMATVHFGRLDGAGGFSRVVALKRLLPHLIQNPEFVEMLLKEARLAARVRHPNVVPTLDVVSSKGEVLIVLEYVHGESLSALCRAHADRQELIPVEIAVGVMLDVLRGLHAVHEATDERGRPLGLVHRDVSPANVIVGTDGLSRVLDFGIVKALELVEETIPNRLKGKTGYMSPEQTRGERVTRASDVFSAAIVLWELLTLHRFASGKTDKDRMDRILSGKYEPPNTYRPELPPELSSVVMKALAVNRDDRFTTAREFAAALETASPFASSGAVADWVHRFADASLAERGRMVAQVENWKYDVGEGKGGPVSFTSESVMLRSSASPRRSKPPPPLEKWITAAPPPAPPAPAPQRQRSLGLPFVALLVLGVLALYVISRWV